MKPSIVPDGIPVLSRGRHRTPRRGACFMELASVLAGERWSDHPSCTHPLLGQLARQVNDQTSDDGRQELALLIPSVVGRRGNDQTWLTVAVAVAAKVILDVPEATQRVLSGGLLQAERVCADAAPDLAATRHGGSGRARAGSRRSRLGRAARGERSDRREDLRQAVRPDDRPVCHRRRRGERSPRLGPTAARHAGGGHRRLSRAVHGDCPTHRHGRAPVPPLMSGSEPANSARHGVGRDANWDANLA